MNKTGLKKIIAVVIVIFELWAIFTGTIEPRIRMGVVLSLVLSFYFLTSMPSDKLSEKMKKFISITNVIFVGLSFLFVCYFLVESERIITRWPQVDQLHSIDILVGSVLILLTLEATRRLLGCQLTMIGAIGLAYIFLGHYLPGNFGHRQFQFSGAIDQLVFTRHALFGSPMDVASSYVFMFIIFGQFFGTSGANIFFFKLAKAAGQRLQGGAAQVAVIAAALFGTINGSPSANVVTTGSITIPTMMKSGFKPEFAGAVEAVAGTGGAMLPPIMGTAAFLMVEMAGVPYKTIIAASAFPAILYYAVLMFSISLRARKGNIQNATADASGETAGKLMFLKDVYYFIPLVVLVILILQGRSLSFTAVSATILTIGISCIKKDTRIGFKQLLESFYQLTRAVTTIVLACATAGLVVGALMLTGLGGKIAHLIIAFSGQIPILALIFTGLLCVILGMGMPVPAAYTLTAALAVPSLYPLGFSPLPTHLFIVYYASLSAITPPVAVAAFAASGICGADPNKIGWLAVRLGITGFILPLVFILNPALLFQDFGADILQNTGVILGTTVGLLCLACVFENYLLGNLKIWERIILLLAACALLLNSGWIYMLFGIAIVAAVLLHQLYTLKYKSREGMDNGISTVRSKQNP